MEVGMGGGGLKFVSLQWKGLFALLRKISKTEADLMSGSSNAVAMTATINLAPISYISETYILEKAHTRQ